MPGRFLFVVSFAVGLSLPAVAFPGHAFAENMHEVESGDTLWKISLKYNCEVAKIQRANKIKGTLIKAGDRLRIPCGGKSKAKRAEQAARAEQVKAERPATDEVAPASGGDAEIATEPAGSSETSAATETVAVKKTVKRAEKKASGPTKYLVVSGDSLFKIAKRYNTTVVDLKVRNGLTSDMIYAGQTLMVLPGASGSGKVVFGQSIGRPHAGRLVNALQLGRGTGYFIRRPNYAWGTHYTVAHIKRAVQKVRTSYPKHHRLAIGDLSARKGGKIPRHRSHQNGRDVDLGFYYRKRPKSYPKEFVTATAQNLHFPATWLLIKALAASAKADGGVERIFLGYKTQGILYRRAKKQGVSRRVLDQLFQYPRGEWAQVGLIRHEPGHNDHLHVRFKCPKGDNACL